MSGRLSETPLTDDGRPHRVYSNTVSSGYSMREEFLQCDDAGDPSLSVDPKGVVG